MPELTPPPPIFDAHFHIIDPRFPLVANQGYLPAAFTAHDYLARANPLAITGGAIVSASFQAFDQTYLVDALAALGPNFVGVTQVPAEISDEEIADLDRCGVRAIRFNLRRGVSQGNDNVVTMARRVHDIAGWHAEFYADAATLEPHLPMLKSLPLIVIDHMGLSADGQPILRDLAAHGAKVKATGFGRLNFDIAAALKVIDDANPGALMFGSDMPSTRAPRPFQAADIGLIGEALGDSGTRRALHDNAAGLYRTANGA